MSCCGNQSIRLKTPRLDSFYTNQPGGLAVCQKLPKIPTGTILVHIGQILGRVNKKSFIQTIDPDRIFVGAIAVDPMGRYTAMLRTHLVPNTHSAMGVNTSTKIHHHNENFRKQAEQTTTPTQTTKKKTTSEQRDSVTEEMDIQSNCQLIIMEIEGGEESCCKKKQSCLNLYILTQPTQNITKTDKPDSSTFTNKIEELSVDTTTTSKTSLSKEGMTDEKPTQFEIIRTTNRPETKLGQMLVHIGQIFGQTHRIPLDYTIPEGRICKAIVFYDPKQAYTPTVASQKPVPVQERPEEQKRAVLITIEGGRNESKKEGPTSLDVYLVLEYKPEDAFPKKSPEQKEKKKPTNTPGRESHPPSITNRPKWKP